ncbi:MAG TPA: amidohydrolase family protein [Chthoniobacterales bacterium]|jgi:cytosine/adenosine deaminase-related metal-dependent hydrolase
MTLYRARYLVSMDAPPVEDGGLLVEGDEIVAVGKFRDLAAHQSATAVDLGEVILMPGLINAHCHLEYSSLRHLIFSQSSFTKWIQRINAAKRNLTDDDYLAATVSGAAELLRHGTTTVVNIESFPELLDRMPALPLRTWWCYELMDIRLRNHSEESMRGAMRFFEPAESELTNFALSPHAPYTASADLYRRSIAAAKAADLLVTTHVAESNEEMQMLQEASGPLYDFLQSIGRDMGDCGQTTPLRHLVEYAQLTPDTLLVHLNELKSEDYPLLAQWAQGEMIHVTHCPKSHRFFQRGKFPYEELLTANANISLGTDSLASNDKLDLFAEMRCFSEAFPQVAPVEIIEMVTCNPARSLKQSGKLGVLRPGAFADAITISAADVSPSEVYEAILQNKRAIPWTMIAGKVVVP